LATIRKRPGARGATYRVQIRVAGKPHVSKSFKRLVDAKEWARVTEQEVRSGRYNRAAQDRTFHDAVVHYYAHDPKQTARRSIIDWWDTEIGHLLLIEVTRGVIIEQRDFLASETPSTRTAGAKRSQATINRYLSNLSILMSAMVEREWIDFNPVKGISRGREEPRRRYLGEKDKDELQRLLDTAKDDPMLNTLVLMALHTGARAGEILGLKWQDIDWQANRAALDQTKTGKPRRLPLNSTVRAALKDLRGDGRIGLIFQADGKPYAYHKPFQAALESAKIRNFRFHDLRHTTASLLANSGHSLHEIAELLGHSTIQTTHRHYAHLSDGVVDDLGEKLNDLVR